MEIHHQERKLRADVRLPELWAELEGVEDLDRLSLDDHVVRAKVAVALPRVPLL